MEEPSSPRAASSGTSSRGKRCSSKHDWMIGRTFSSTSRPTESCTMRSSSDSALRTSNRSIGSSAFASSLNRGLWATMFPPQSKPAPSYHWGLYCRGPLVKIPEIIIVETIHQPGSLAKVLMVIAEAGLAIEHLTALRRDQGRTVWEITLEMDEEADRSLYERIGQLPTARFVGKSDRVFNRHRGGKIRTVASLPINTRQVLRDVYTPGVARVCLAIQKDAQAALDFTALGRTVAIVTNGTAVLRPGHHRGPPGAPGLAGQAAVF